MLFLSYLYFREILFDLEFIQLFQIQWKHDSRKSHSPERQIKSLKIEFRNEWNHEWHDDQLTRSFPAVYLVVAERHSWKFVQSTSNKHDEKVMMKNKSKTCLLYLVQNKIEMTWLVPFTSNYNRSFSRTRLFKTCFDRFLSIEEWFSILFSHRFFPIGQWFWTSSFCSKSKPKWTC